MVRYFAFYVHPSSSLFSSHTFISFSSVSILTSSPPGHVVLLLQRMDRKEGRKETRLKESERENLVKKEITIR